VFLIDQIIAICDFEGIPYQMTPDLIDRAWANMFVKDEKIVQAAGWFDARGWAIHPHQRAMLDRAGDPCHSADRAHRRRQDAGGVPADAGRAWPTARTRGCTRSTSRRSRRSPPTSGAT
jgi:hypothetical protein